MNFNLPDIQILRNNIDFCSIAQFFHTFATAFGPWPSTAQDIIYARHTEPNNDYVFETEDLERMLLETSERIRLEDLFVRMLRLVSRNRFINSSNWQTYYSKEFDKREYDQTNPFIKQQEEEETEQQPSLEGGEVDIKKPELLNYFTFDLGTRVHLLHLLCEWQLDEPERFREHLDSEDDAVQWRVDPIGFDKKGSTFWLFDDNRLYKETPKPKPVKKSNARNKKKKRTAAAPPPAVRYSRRSTRSSTVQEEPVPIEEVEEEESEDEGEWVPWKLLCYTKYEWENFPTKYANSKHIDEQRFYQLLVNDLLPKVLPVLEEHEEKIKKQEAIIHRKRSSRIMIKELEALERGSVEPVLEDSYSPSIGAGGRSRSNRIEQRALEKEHQEKEAMAKAREERLLERERRIMEREYRALKRQASEDVVPETAVNTDTTPKVEDGPIIIDGTTPLPSVKPKASKKSAAPATTTTTTGAEQKPKRKYVKKPKFDENGNPIPRKVKLDKDGNPIPLKKRGRKPKNRDEDNWLFDCVCGVSGENIDDGTPLVACERCGTWQHIACLQKSGQISKNESLDNLKFVCHKCERYQEEEEHEREHKRQRNEYYSAIASPPVPSGYPPQMPTLQSSWHPQQHPTSAITASQPISVAQQPQHQYQHPQQQPQQQAYHPPNNSVLPPIRSHLPNQAQTHAQQQQQQPHQPLPIYNRIQQQQRPMVNNNYPPSQPVQQQQQYGNYPPIAMNPPSHQPMLNSSQTYPQATVAQQQTIQSIVSQVASNPVSLAQLANLLDKNLQQKRQ